MGIRLHVYLSLADLHYYCHYLHLSANFRLERVCRNEENWQTQNIYEGQIARELSDLKFSLGLKTGKEYKC